MDWSYLYTPAFDMSRRFLTSSYICPWVAVASAQAAETSPGSSKDPPAHNPNLEKWRVLSLTVGFHSFLECAQIGHRVPEGVQWPHI